MVCRGYSLLVLLMLALVAGCSSLVHLEPVRVSVVGIEPLPHEELEARFTVKLRVQNPNETAIHFDGVFIDLELENRSFGSGVSDQKGTVPRFGEALISVPVTVPFTAVARQLLGLASNKAPLDRLNYRLRGRLGGGNLFGGVRFDKKGGIQLGGDAPQ